MPVSRSPVRSVSGIPYHGHPASTRNMHIEVNNSAAQYNSLLSPHPVPGSILAPPSTSPPAKRRRTPNAFILYRSFIIANRLYPTELSHQSDVSRHVAEMWKALTPSERSIFFKMAEEKRRIQLESHGEEPYKKRRSRSRKADTTRDRSRHGEVSPTSAEGCLLSTSSMPVSSSPLGTFTPSFDLLTLPLRGASALPLTPQSIHAISPHLLNWGQELNSNPSDEVGSNELEPIWPSSHLSTPFQIPYRSDIAFFDSLDSELFNFQLSTDMRIDFTSSSPDTPPFGVYLPV